jgi:hypothetical protein
MAISEQSVGNVSLDSVPYGPFCYKVYFNGTNNLEHLRQRIRAEMEQISPDIIERSVQSVDKC